MDDINDAEEMFEESLENNLDLGLEEQPMLDSEPPSPQIDNLELLSVTKQDWESRKEFLNLLAEKTKEEYTRISKDNTPDEYKKYNLSHLRQITKGISRCYKLNNEYIKMLDGALMIIKMGPKNKKVVDTCSQYLKDSTEELEKKASIFRKKNLKMDPYAASMIGKIERFLTEAVVATRGYTDQEKIEYLNERITQKKTNISR